MRAALLGLFLGGITLVGCGGDDRWRYDLPCMGNIGEQCQLPDGRKAFCAPDGQGNDVCCAYHPIDGICRENPCGLDGGASEIGKCACDLECPVGDGCHSGICSAN